ncbi:MULTISPECIES: DUF2584 domain-containing protein [Neobacillus]|uniref:DUF2584 domain-containing protein n=1 Tax=Neobacillus rhizophilus TaxID=2833579 RepID=A0A942UDH5_9BACI|nr:MULTISPECIES: DUF2584 domain-containing protein [Neobacillus]MBS4215289.1 DUF2584 domain-containing protein [Neobacillus rhizophilus]MBU8919636.1 DUF2584 domain-containing protein [Bacillus sp. FJAT-29953]
MGMPLELNTLIVTKGNEKRIGENLFVLVKEGYRLYPIEIPVDVRKTLDTISNGTALIKKVEWENSRTTLTYQLISLNSTN